MPLIDGEDVSPDDAMKAGKCPECGVDLKKVNPIAHRKEHWEVLPHNDRGGQEALRRMAMFDQYIVDNKVRTTNMRPELKPKAAAEGKPAEIPL